MLNARLGEVVSFLYFSSAPLSIGFCRVQLGLGLI